MPHFSEHISLLGSFRLKYLLFFDLKQKKNIEQNCDVYNKLAKVSSSCINLNQVCIKFNYTNLANFTQLSCMNGNLVTLE